MEKGCRIKINMEEKLIAERNMYQSLLDECSELMTVVDAQTFQIIYANRAALDATKHLKDGYVGNICYRCIQNADKPCPSCILSYPNAPESETKDVDYGGHTYRMTYKKIIWNGKPALFESSEDISEQKQNLRLIEENGRQHERIIANLPTGIIVFRVSHGLYSIVQVNPAICKIMNIDPVKALKLKGDYILMLTHPDDRKIVADAARKLAVPDVEVYYEFRNLNRETNRYFWTAADGRSAAQPDGSVLVYISYTDITARKEKDDEYKRQISALNEMDDETLIAKGQHNLTQNQVIVYTAKSEFAAKVIMGSSYDDAVKALADVAMTAQKYDELMLLTSREYLIGQFREGKTEDAIEFRRLMPNQKIVWTVVKYSLFEEPKTQDIILFMYSYDITERVTERKILSRLGNMEYDLFGLLNVGTGRYILLSQLIHTNERMFIKEGDFDEVVQNKIPKYIDKEERDSVQDQLTIQNVIAELASKEVYSLMYSIVLQDNSRKRKRFQFTYLDEMKDTILFFRSDITDIYMKEREQLKQIEQALETAKTASSAKTEFFSRMSHDMRTPMNGILGIAALSEDENDAAVLQENISKIKESGQYLLGLINDTLDFQRIESGKLTLEPQIVDSRVVLSSIVDMVKKTAEDKGVKLLINNINADLDWYVRMDSLRFRQILINLLSNAIKFTPAGGTVEFAFELLFREGMISHDLLTIRDTGIGMSEDFLKNKIFTPFSQESNSVTAQYAGSGLGLSIAKSLVELMNGRIEVESELGAGTTFRIYLDFERVNKEEAQTMVQSGKLHTQAIQEILYGKHVLLVEDHPLNAEIGIKLLKKVGCGVDWLQNGEEAVNYFKNSVTEQYDVILMDIRMPVMDGLEAARQIRSLNNTYAKRIPIIAMTANAYEEDIRHSLESGMNAHLSKPIDPNILYDTLLKFI